MNAGDAMICTRCNRLSSDTERCSTCGTHLKTLRSQKTRGWFALVAAAFLAVFMGAIWIWVDRLMAANAPSDLATAQFLGKINVAFALIVVAGLLGTVNGVLMVRSGRRNLWLIVGLLLAFVIALFIAWSASSAYHPS